MSRTKRDVNEVWVEPFVGLRGRYPLSDDVSAGCRGDIPHDDAAPGAGTADAGQVDAQLPAEHEVLPVLGGDGGYPQVGLGEGDPLPVRERAALDDAGLDVPSGVYMTEVWGSWPINGHNEKQRKKVVPRATGRVLEVGMGPGLNLPFYDRSNVELVWGLEPSEGMRRKAAPALAATDIDVRWLDLPGEQIPLDDDSADTVVLTYTLCTIPDVGQALSEVRRVLKPGGALLFCEHGEAPDAAVHRWQQRASPVWKYLGGGCHLDRPIPRLLEASGFSSDDMQTMYIPGWKPACFNYWGSARAV